MKIFKLMLITLTVCLAIQCSGDALHCFSAGVPAVSAEETWKKEFEEVCAQTEMTAGLTADELKALIARCDTLKPAIERLDESTKKVYLKRLQMCRELFAYMLSLKEKDSPGKPN